MTTIDPRKSGKAGLGALPTNVVYDVIVLGSQLAGAVTGALLVKRGYRVLFVDPDGLGAHYEHKGYQLPYAPSMLPHLRRMPPAEAALTELGIGVDLFRALDGAAASDLQLLFPRHRIDLSVEPERRAAEVGREFPGEKDVILSSLGAAQARSEATDPFFKLSLPFPPDGFFERRAVKKAAATCPPVLADGEIFDALAKTPFADALQSLGRFLTHLEDAEAGSLARLRPVAQLLHGACRYPGGYDGLREAVRARLADLGGDVLGDPHAPAEVEELLFDGGRFSGIKLQGSSNVYRGECLVCGMDVASLAALIPPRAKKRHLADLLESVRVRRQLFTVNLVIKDEGLPLGLKDLALVHPGDEFHGPVLLEVLHARKAGKDVSGEKVLCASALVTHNEHSNSDERIQSVAGRLEAVIGELAPFVEQHIVERSIPSLHARHFKGTRLVYHPLMEVDADHVLGIAGLPHRTPCKNLFLASREVIPGLGVEGEFLAATRAATLVQGVIKKHDPLK
ncbi:MAG TPA: NAD(P)-binding protein [Myxococcales bacterium]